MDYAATRGKGSLCGIVLIPTSREGELGLSILRFMKSRITAKFVLGATVVTIFGVLSPTYGQYWTPVPAGAPVVESSLEAQGAVLVSGVTSAGKLLVSTGYPIVNGKISDGGWLRLNSDGTTDTTYRHPIGAAVLLVYPDGRILIARHADSNGFTIRLYRLLENGDDDPSFSPLLVDYDSCNAELLSDGRIFLFGRFASVGGVSRKFVAMINDNGTLVSEFESPFVSNPYFINSAKATADGQHIVIGGGGLGLGPGLAFVARLNLNGSVDPGFNAADAGFSGDSVTRVYPDAQGGVLVSRGSLNIIRLTSTGAPDAGFATNLVGANWVFGPQQTDRKIFYLALGFVGSTYSRQLRRMNPDGSDDSTFSVISTPYACSYEIGLPSLSGDGTFFVGPMTAERKAAHFELTHVLANGSVDAGYNPRLSAQGSVGAHALLLDGKCLIAGFFDHINNTAISPSPGMALVRLKSDGSVDPSFDAALPSTPGQSSGVDKILVQPNGKLVLFGSFPNESGYSSIIRLDAYGALDTTFPLFPMGLLSTAVDNLGNIYGCESATGSRLLRYSPDGVVDTAFQAPDLGVINLTVPLIDGSVLVYNTPAYPNFELTRLLSNGSKDPNFNAPYLPGIVTIAALPDGNVMICQAIGNSSGAVFYRIVRLLPNGAINYSYTAQGAAQNSGPRESIRLALAGSLFDLLREAAPGIDAVMTADFSQSEQKMVVSCRTNGQVMVRSTSSQYDIPFRTYQRTALAGLSMDAAPFVIDLIKAFSPLPLNATYSAPFVSAGGLAPFTYQWLKNGVPVPGQTDSNLNFDLVKEIDAGNYSVKVSSAQGFVISSSFPIAVDTSHSAPTFINQPESQATPIGGSATFTVTAEGIPAPTFQWLKDGSYIGGATSSSYKVMNVGPGDTGTYSVVATNSAWITYSTPATLTVLSSIAAPKNAVITITVE